MGPLTSHAVLLDVLRPYRLRIVIAASALIIVACAMLCFIALSVYRVMRQRLQLAKSDLSPEKALA